MEGRGGGVGTQGEGRALIAGEGGRGRDGPRIRKTSGVRERGHAFDSAADGVFTPALHSCPRADLGGLVHIILKEG